MPGHSDGSEKFESGLHDFQPPPPLAWTAVIAAIVTMSSTLQPRDRSCIGFARPCRIGPNASACARRSVILYAMFPEFRSGNTNTLARPATWDPGAFLWPTLST